MSKHVEIIAIGDELLNGNTVNTNAAYIGSKLQAIGLQATSHRTVGDDVEAICRVLRESLAKNDLVVTTGGLGPTIDDITRSAISQVVGSPIATNEKVLAHLRARYGDRLPNLEDQALIPEKARPFLNMTGTAPGLLFEEQGKYLAVLPGVPVEMREMLDNQLIPFLEKAFPKEERLISLESHFHTLREADIDPAIRELQKKHPGVAFGIYPHQGTVTVRVRSPRALQDEAVYVLNQLREKFAGNFFAAPTIAEEVLHQFVKRGLTLSTAESCTGGRIASEITAVAGASDYFLGSVVAYSNALKQKLLAVPEKMLEEHGAVSAEVVEAMVEGVLNLTASDWAVAVTGIAGPSGGTAEKPVGTIWCAIGKKGEAPVSWRLTLRGNREANIQRTVHLVLGKLLTKTD